MKFSLDRFDPSADMKPTMQDDRVLRSSTHMALDALLQTKEEDDSLTIRKSCHEDACGSEAINTNGCNGLACVPPVIALKAPVVLRALPSFPVLCNRVADMAQACKQYDSIKPYLIYHDFPA